MFTVATNSCPFCRKNNPEPLETHNVPYADEDGYIETYEHEVFLSDTNFKFCPMCGRDLKGDK